LSASIAAPCLMGPWPLPSGGCVYCWTTTLAQKPLPTRFWPCFEPEPTRMKDGAWHIYVGERSYLECWSRRLGGKLRERVHEGPNLMVFWTGWGWPRLGRKCGPVDRPTVPCTDRDFGASWRGREPGRFLRALAEWPRMDSGPPRPKSLGFLLWTRINGRRTHWVRPISGRRIAGPAMNPHEAQSLAEKLRRLLKHRKRRDVETAVRAAALVNAETRGYDARWFGRRALAGTPAWWALFASRLKEGVKPSSVVIGFEMASGKGSGRSVSGNDLGSPDSSGLAAEAC